MKAKELIKILSANPEADIKIGYEELVVYSELTTGSEDRIEPIAAIFVDSENAFVFSVEHYLIGNKIWSNCNKD